MKNPPKVTKNITGRPAYKASTPLARAASLIGVPASNPRAKQALITPANKATSNPFVNAKSLTAAFFSSSVIFLERKLPA